VKNNLSVTFCSVTFFVVAPREKTAEQICTHNGSKCVKSAKDVPFAGFVINGPPTSLQILKILHYKSHFSLKTHINLGGSPTKIRIRIENSTWGFQIWG